MKGKLILLPLLFSICCSQLLTGQDSLSVRLELLKKREADSLTAANYLNDAIKYFALGKSDSAISNSRRSVSYASTYGFTLTEAQAYEFEGSVYDSLSDWEEMLYCWLKANSLYGKLTDRPREAYVLKKIATKYFDLGLYESSATYFEQLFSVCPVDREDEMAGAAEAAAKSWYFKPVDSLAIKWYSAAIHYYEKTGAAEKILRCKEKLAALYTRTGSYDEASTVYKNMMKSFESNKDKKGRASILNNTGFIKFRNGDYQGALTDFRGAVQISENVPENYPFLSDVYSNIAICNQNLGNRSETINSFTMALDYAGKSGRLKEKAAVELFLASIYLHLKDYYHADLYCQDCIESSRIASSPEIMLDCYKTWSTVMEEGNDFVMALSYYEKYLSIRDSLAFEQRIADRNEKDRIESYKSLEQKVRLDIADQEIQGLALKNLLAESQRKENELKLLLKQKELDRSERERLSQSLALEREHTRLLRREQEVRSLEQQKINDSLLIKVKADSSFALVQSNRILENEKKQQELMIDKQKQYKQMALGIGILLFLVAASILVGLMSTRRKNIKLADSKKLVEKANSDLELRNREVLEQNEKISVQKSIIELKNQAITDSIQYASRIQNAVLPPDDFIAEMGIDNFILYKPKDIISGDFYWGLKKDDKIYIAAADCTGHGVPGALMSMLGHVFLDEILHTSSSLNAAEILDRLRDEVINTLKQKGVTGEARDGMDIALLVIDNEKHRIDFAGANNPLYLVRDQKLTKVLADKMPIGIHVTTIDPFTNQVIEFRKEDLVYIFSDGYADQFGGPKGKKFMYKPFQDLLARNSIKPMDLQKEILDNTFIKWKGDRSQIDDVLIIGLRL